MTDQSHEREQFAARVEIFEGWIRENLPWFEPLATSWPSMAAYLRWTPMHTKIVLAFADAECEQSRRLIDNRDDLIDKAEAESTRVIQTLRARIDEMAGERERLLYTSDKQTVAWKERALKAEARLRDAEGLLADVLADVSFDHTDCDCVYCRIRAFLKPAEPQPHPYVRPYLTAQGCASLLVAGRCMADEHDPIHTPEPKEEPRDEERDWKAVHPFVRNWIINILLHPMATGTYRRGVHRETTLSESEFEERRDAARAAINLLAKGTGYALALEETMGNVTDLDQRDRTMAGAEPTRHQYESNAETQPLNPCCKVCGRRGFDPLHIPGYVLSAPAPNEASPQWEPPLTDAERLRRFKKKVQAIGTGEARRRIEKWINEHTRTCNATNNASEGESGCICGEEDAAPAAPPREESELLTEMRNLPHLPFPYEEPNTSGPLAVRLVNSVLRAMDMTSSRGWGAGENAALLLVQEDMQKAADALLARRSPERGGKR